MNDDDLTEYSELSDESIMEKILSISPVRKGEGKFVPAASGADTDCAGDTSCQRTVVLPHAAAITEEEKELSIKDIVSDLPVKPRDRYKFIRSIGFGGMKTVLLVRDNDTGRNVAMAMLPANDAASAGKIKRFIQEARITARLEHPNIVAVHDIGLDVSGTPYFTMRYLKGATLAKIISRLRSGDENYLQNYTLGRMIQIFRRVCNAIAFAHSQNVMHLDLKPENVHIGDYGDVQVIDWGLARLIEDGDMEHDADIADNPAAKENQEYFDAVLSGRTIDGIAKGTPGFMAPEQAAGKNREKDERTDIYALGCLLFTMLTFESPLGKLKGEAAVAATIKGDIQSPTEVENPVMAIPGTLEAICLKAMSREKDTRYQSVEELLEDIRQFSSGFAPKAAKAGVFHRFLLFLIRNRYQLILTSFLALIAILVYLYWREILSFNW